MKLEGENSNEPQSQPLLIADVSGSFTDEEWLILYVYKDQIERFKNTGGVVFLQSKQWAKLPKLLEKYDDLVKNYR